MFDWLTNTFAGQQQQQTQMYNPQQAMQFINPNSFGTGQMNMATGGMYSPVAQTTPTFLGGSQNTNYSPVQTLQQQDTNMWNNGLNSDGTTMQFDSSGGIAPDQSIAMDPSAMTAGDMWNTGLAGIGAAANLYYMNEANKAAQSQVDLGWAQYDSTQADKTALQDANAERMATSRKQQSA